MTKITQKTLERQICNGITEVEYEANRFGLIGLRDRRTNRQYTARLI